MRRSRCIDIDGPRVPESDLGLTEPSAGQTVAVPEQRTIAISGWISKGPPASQLARLDVEWLAADGTVIDTDTIGTVASSTSYTPVENSNLTSPNNCTVARIELMNAPTVMFAISAGFDDLSPRATD